MLTLRKQQQQQQQIVAQIGAEMVFFILMLSSVHSDLLVITYTILKFEMSIYTRE